MNQHVGDIGEWELIKIISEIAELPENLPLKFGDDAVGVSSTPGILVINTDMLVESTDRPPGMTHYQMGRKSVIMNFSDLAAKGVQPYGFLLSLGIPSNCPVNEFREIIKGVNSGARENQAWFLGGDTNESKESILSGTAFGFAQKVISREGSHPGDFVATTGDFGDTAAGLKVLLGDRTVSESLKSDLLKAVYEPQVRINEGRALSKIKGVTACIDSSDGLALSLHQMAELSGVGFQVEELPVSRTALEFANLSGDDHIELTLYGGEEFHLVFTIDPGSWEQLVNAMPTTRKIGTVIDDKKVVYLKDGVEHTILRKGWTHFLER